MFSTPKEKWSSNVTPERVQSFYNIIAMQMNVLSPNQPRNPKAQIGNRKGRSSDHQYIHELNEISGFNVLQTLLHPFVRLLIKQRILYEPIIKNVFVCETVCGETKRQMHRGSPV